MATPGDVDPEESLGRGIGFKERELKEQKRLRKRLRQLHKDFMPQQGRNEVSVDRISIAPRDEIVTIASRREKEREPSRTFGGWAFVTPEEAARNGRHVVATSIEGNDYHADITFPQKALGNQDEQKEHAWALAAASRWCPLDYRFVYRTQVGDTPGATPLENLESGAGFLEA
ncbi:MAG: hypothetical protein F4Y97_00330 [Dehalococcoidia bacterium]|nr:hypothetical protein [Dehalococcoidia bacterium]